jgi:hypothetical protein
MGSRNLSSADRAQSGGLDRRSVIAAVAVGELLPDQLTAEGRSWPVHEQIKEQLRRRRVIATVTRRPVHALVRGLLVQQAGRSRLDSDEWRQSVPYGHPVRPDSSDSSVAVCIRVNAHPLPMRYRSQFNDSE